MKKIIPISFVWLLLSGCGSTKYGHSLDVWNGMTQQQRDQAILRAESMMERTRENQRVKEFVYQPVNAVFGSRSNVYGNKIYPY